MPLIIITTRGKQKNRVDERGSYDALSQQQHKEGKAAYKTMSDESEEEQVVGEEEESEGLMEESSEASDTTWVSWFVNLRGNEFFCEVDEDFIQDDFNLTGLQAVVPHFDYALDLILDVDVPMDSLSVEQQESVEAAAEALYGLIHARYILTARGMQKMFEKYEVSEFGHCPRVHCHGQNVLPIGLSDQHRNYPVNIYCPKCLQLYYPRSSKQTGLDGAFFGTTFAHMLLLSYPDEIQTKPTPEDAYTPRIYGFKISKDSEYYRLRDREAESEEEEESSDDDDHEDEIGEGKMDEEEGQAGAGAGAGAAKDAEELEDHVDQLNLSESQRNEERLRVAATAIQQAFDAKRNERKSSSRKKAR